MNEETRVDVDDTTAPAEATVDVDVDVDAADEAADLGIEEFDLDDIEVIESKVFG
ncbi:MAG: hypothetical protein HOV94_24215 [Saccharothrix sp.]|nr:hypothetical protein [Saccharothrix sp.]